MESPHQIFFKLHEYYQTINKIKDFSSYISAKYDLSNLLLYNFVKCPLYNHYLVFSQPPLTDQFANKDLQDLTLRFAQLHISCVEKCEQNGYTLTDQFDSSTLPNLDEFFNHSLQMLNSSLGNVDILRDDSIFPLLCQFFKLIAQECQFIDGFCLILHLNIQDYDSMVRRFVDQTKTLFNPKIGIEERSKIIYELFQTVIFLGVPFIVGYESFAWIPRPLLNIFQFEKSLIDDYLDQINQRITPAETMPLGTWFNESQTFMVQNPPYNDGLPLIDIIFIQALTSASNLYNYTQLGQYATYIQARFEIEIGTAVIIIGKFYNPTINQWIESQDFHLGSKLLAIGHLPLNQVHIQIDQNELTSSPKLDSSKNLIEKPSSHEDELLADIIFAETAGDFSTPPKLEEIERILSILKGDVK